MYDMEGDIACQRAARRLHRDVANGGTCGDGCCQKRIRSNLEVPRESVERDTRCPSESLAENFCRLPCLPSLHNKCNKRTEAGIEGEDGSATNIGAAAAGPSAIGCAVELAACALKQRAKRDCPYRGREVV